MKHGIWLMTLVLTAFGCGKPVREKTPVGDRAALRVMTYNVNFGLAGDPETMEAIRDGAAELVLLQETTEQWEVALDEELAELYPYRAYHHCCGAGGLAFLSKHPFRNERIIEPPREGWFPAWVVVVDSPIGPIQALNVHLRPPFDDDGSMMRGYFVTKDIRRAEIESYVDALEPDIPAIVAGDFNENRRGRAVGFLEARGMRTALPEFAPDAKTWQWNTSVGPVSAQLDHIVYDSALQPVEAEVREVGRSDHWPVVATFVMRDGV